MSFPFKTDQPGPPLPPDTLWTILPQSVRTWLVRAALCLGAVVALAVLAKWAGLGS